MAVALAFWSLLLRRRFSAPPPLAKFYVAVIVSSLIGSLLNLEFVTGNSGILTAAKTFDGLLRGLAVFLISASVEPTPRNLRIVAGTLAVAIVTFALLGVLERFAPHSAFVEDVLVPSYGGPISDDKADIHAILKMNHKALMLDSDRATAVFVTAPALGMAAVFILPIALLLEWPRWVRLITVGACIIAGLTSNSKSFVFGTPVVLAYLLLFQRKSIKVTLPVLVVPLIAAAAAFILQRYSSDHFIVSPIDDFAESDDKLVLATGGRLGRASWSVFDPVLIVLSESPIFGFGLGYHPHILYSDSSINALLLHGGLIALLAFAAGISLQFRDFFRAWRLSTWAVIGSSTLVAMCALSLAGAVFMMPRVNDIVFTILGISASAIRHPAMRPQTVVRHSHAALESSAHRVGT